MSLTLVYLAKFCRVWCRQRVRTIGFAMLRIISLQCAQLVPKVGSDVTCCSIIIPFQAPNLASSSRKTVLAFDVGIMTHSRVSHCITIPILAMFQWFARFRGTYCTMGSGFILRIGNLRPLARPSVMVHCHIGPSLYIELRPLVPEQVCTLAAVIARSRLWIRR